MKNDSKEDMQRITGNIRLLREHWEDTREVLSEELANNNYPVAVVTIKSYENGQRDIPPEYVEALAKIYNISTRIVMEQELTKELLDSYYAQLNFVSYLKDIDFMFFNAAVTSDSALLNEDFVRANEHFKALVNYDFENMVSPTVIRELYYKSFVEGDVLAGAANTLMMLFMEYVGLNFDPFSIQKAIKGSLTNGQLYERLVNVWNEITPEKQSFLVETKEVFDRCIKGLAQKGARTYAEYYMALKYFFCMIDNGRSYRENLEIARVIMTELKNIDNKLVISFIEKYDKDNEYFC